MVTNIWLIIYQVIRNTYWCMLKRGVVSTGLWWTNKYYSGSMVLTHRGALFRDLYPYHIWLLIYECSYMTSHIWSSYTWVHKRRIYWNRFNFRADNTGCWKSSRVPYSGNMVLTPRCVLCKDLYSYYIWLVIYG